jgi:hypothetical protein
MTTLDITADANLTNNTTLAATDRLLLVDDGTTALQDTTVAILTTYILTTPTITNFSSATHNHSSTATGGTLARGLILHSATLGGTSGWSPADATTYYFGTPQNLTPVTTAAMHRIYIPVTGTITRVDLAIHNNAGTVGSNESSTFYIRLNNTTDTTLSSAVKMDAASGSTNYYNVTGLSIAVTAGEYIEYKILTATFTTNPTNVVIDASLYMAIT